MTKIQNICSESITWMKSQESSSFDLIIADPPYNVGKDYGNNQDTRIEYEYTKFMNEWTEEASRLLKPTGTIYSFMGFRKIAELYTIFEKRRGLKFCNWIVWHYTQGIGKRRGFSPRHDDILMFTKSDNYTFNLDPIRVPQKFYRKVNNMRGANPGDVWEFSHVHYCQENRQDHPTQKPEALIERLVLASTNKGDRVLDPFSGSGTTQRVCQQLERECIGVDINPEYVKMSDDRISRDFFGFDSIDPKMKRIPNDLNDETFRESYISDHIEWFLKNHDADIKDFLKDVAEKYGNKTSRKRRSVSPQKLPLLDA